MQIVYNFFGGRTAFVVCFGLFAATVLAAFSRLTPAYAAVLTAIPAIQAGRSAFEDFKGTN